MAFLSREDYRKAWPFVGMLIIWIAGEELLLAQIGKDFARSIAMGFGWGFFLFFSKTKGAERVSASFVFCFILLPLATVGIHAILLRFFADSWVPVLAIVPIAIAIRYAEERLLHKQSHAPRCNRRCCPETARRCG